MPADLRTLIINLISENETQIEVAFNKTKPIKIMKGVPQGSPLSPTLFNLSIDHIIRDLTDINISKAYGFSTDPTLPELSCLAFADDLALISTSITGIESLLHMTEAHLSSIGLTINPHKSKLIYLNNGILSPLQIVSINGDKILSMIDPHERIKYLGVNFNDVIVFDETSIIKNLNANVTKLAHSQLLNADQKISILNQYIWPSIIYPLQCAPLNKIKTGFLNDIDKIIKGATKNIIGLPHDCPDAMLYSPKKFRGMGLMRAAWEAYIQHYNICRRLLHVEDQHLHAIRDLKSEITSSLNKLGITDDVNDWSSRRLRKALQTKAFETWSTHTIRGKGVTVYADLPKNNSWVSNRKGLSISEWTNAIKMSSNITAVRAIPGRSFSTTRCRYPNCNEKETLGHVLGSCKKNELLINSRHHKIRSMLASTLKDNKWLVFEEVHCLSTTGSTRRADIVAIDKSNKKAFVLDPTIRFEINTTQAEEVDKEKRSIYEPCLPYLSKHYQINLKHWKVIGLLFGCRGAVTNYTWQNLKSLGISQEVLHNITLSIIKDSLIILHHHLYHTD